MSNTLSDAPNPSIELLEPADYGQYLLYSRSEIEHLLRQLRERNCQISVFFNDGADLVLTTLLNVSSEGITLDCGGSSNTNLRAQKATRLFCVTTLDKVKIQFILSGLKSVEHEDRPAFHAAFPKDMLRLQRREFYRLVLPLTRRLTCQIPLDDEHSIAADVLDLSGGGLAMVIPPKNARFDPGMTFPNCRMELPDTGVITATVQVLTAFEITLRNGSHVKRAGCKFIDMPGTMTNLIQRYIIKMERERKAYENGLL